MKALILNGTLKRSPDGSNTEALAGFVGERLRERGVDVEQIRVVDHDVAPGVVSEAVDEGDGWPAIHARLLDAEIVILATPTWLGQPSSVIKRVLERMDAMVAETDDRGAPVAFSRVAGIVVTGNEDGAHHVISQLAQGLVDVGYTVPGQAWTYWNKGPGPSDYEYATSDEVQWTHATGETMAFVLVEAATALQENPIGVPPSASS